jgi:hypothetical protein
MRTGSIAGRRIARGSISRHDEKKGDQCQSAVVKEMEFEPESERYVGFWAIVGALQPNVREQMGKFDAGRESSEEVEGSSARPWVTLHQPSDRRQPFLTCQLPGIVRAYTEHVADPASHADVPRLSAHLYLTPFNYGLTRCNSWNVRHSRIKAPLARAAYHSTERSSSPLGRPSVYAPKVFGLFSGVCLCACLCACICICVCSCVCVCLCL